MPELSLTDLVDIVSASGTPKATKVRQVKQRPTYHPSLDYYKQIREGISWAHQQGASKQQLLTHIGPVTDSKKVANYSAIQAGYRRWWGNKSLVWFSPPSGMFTAHGIDVRVNPELGLNVNGTPHLIKLYFKTEQLTKTRIDIITHLMQSNLARRAPAGCTMSVLDCRNHKLISPTVPIAGLGAVLDAELAYVAALWPQV